jgi:hypothetical protein
MCVEKIAPFFLIAFVALLPGCSSTGSANAPLRPSVVPREFSNADWEKVLGAVVTPDGYVKWDLIQSDANGVRAALMNYVGLVQAVSPENHPEMFAGENYKLAYWLNAFNAMCMYAVVEHNYPSGMLVGDPPGAIFSTEEFTFGGHRMTLDELVLKNLGPPVDARVYFAVNFCARSSAPLRQSPYDGEVLDAQLVDQGQRYLSDPRAAVRDGNAVKLNDLILSIHRQEILAGFQSLMGREPKGILDALQPYVESDSPIVGATKVEKLGFDWGLNRPPR